MWALEWAYVGRNGALDADTVCHCKKLPPACGPISEPMWLGS